MCRYHRRYNSITKRCQHIVFVKLKSYYIFWKLECLKFNRSERRTKLKRNDKTIFYLFYHFVVGHCFPIFLFVHLWFRFPFRAYILVCSSKCGFCCTYCYCYSVTMYVCVWMCNVCRQQMFSVSQLIVYIHRDGDGIWCALIRKAIDCWLSVFFCFSIHLFLLYSLSLVSFLWIFSSLFFSIPTECECFATFVEHMYSITIIIAIPKMETVRTNIVRNETKRKRLNSVSILWSSLELLLFFPLHISTLDYYYLLLSLFVSQFPQLSFFPVLDNNTKLSSIYFSSSSHFSFSFYYFHSLLLISPSISYVHLTVS